MDLTAFLGIMQLAGCVVALSLQLVFPMSAEAVPPVTERPNILFICTDDQAAWAIGESGNQQAVTPHMDRLAAESAYLVNSFVTTPVCSPSRAATLTGRYGFEVGIDNWLKATDQTNGLPTDLVTFADVLRSAGYQTALVGKWHLGMNDRFHPTKQGFDYFMGHRHGGFKTVDPDLEEMLATKTYKGLTADILADHVIRRLELYSGSENRKPFLLCWHTRAPHTRWLPVAPEDMQPYLPDRPLQIPSYPDLDRPRVTRMMREYLASVRSVDRNLGRVLNSLETLNLADNTVVIYTSDHGYNMGHHGLWHKGNGIWALNHDVPASDGIAKNYRPNMFDRSIRVPTLVRWPGVVKPGRRIAQTTSNLDWFPTLLEISRSKPPAFSAWRGRSLMPLLRGETPKDWDNDFFGFYSSDYENQFVEEMRMLRTPQWKLVRYLRGTTPDELFDLEKDPDESTNLLAEQHDDSPRVVRKLYEQLADRMRELNDPALPLLSAK